MEDYFYGRHKNYRIDCDKKVVIVDKICHLHQRWKSHAGLNALKTTWISEKTWKPV